MRTRTLALNVFWATGVYLAWAAWASGATMVHITPMLQSCLVCGSWLLVCAAGAKLGSMTKETSRKLLHAGTIPIFLVTWSWWFPGGSYGPSVYACALVPWLTTALLTVAGMGWRVFPLTLLVGAVSRTGAPKELHEGPLLYGIAAIWGTVLGWAQPWLGAGPLLILAAGDAAAALVGRRVGGPQLSWSRPKTVAGVVGFVGASLAALFWWGDVHGGTPGAGYGTGFVSSAAFTPLLIATAVGAAVESLPYAEDNILVWGATTAVLWFMGA